MVLPNVRRLPVITRLAGNGRRRLLLAFTLAIVLHAIVAAFLRAPQQPIQQEPPTTEHVTITKRVPTPTPRPVARITPQPHASIAARIAVYNPAPKAAAPVRTTHGGLAAHKHAVLATPPPLPVHPRHVSFAQNTGAGSNNGGAGTGAGAGVGAGGDAGTGSGVGGIGSGNGSDASTQPCGYVEFTLSHEEVRAGKEYDWVRILVHLRDGDTVTDELGWPFVYAGDADNPFSKQNENTPNFTMTMQPPPPDYDLEGQQQEATVLAVERTGPDGYTLLDPCPGQT